MHRNIQNVILVIACFIVTGCFSSSHSDSGSIPTVFVSGLGATTTINEAELFDRYLSVQGNTVTIASGNQVSNIALSGFNNMLTIQSDVNVNSIDASGSDNSVFAPISSGVSFTSHSGLNDTLTKQ